MEKYWAEQKKATRERLFIIYGQAGERVGGGGGGGKGEQ